MEYIVGTESTCNSGADLMKAIPILKKFQALAKEKGMEMTVSISTAGTRNRILISGRVDSLDKQQANISEMMSEAGPLFSELAPLIVPGTPVDHIWRVV